VGPRAGLDAVVKRKIMRRNDRGKVVPVLLFTEHNAMKAYWGSGGIAPRINGPGTRRR